MSDDALQRSADPMPATPTANQEALNDEDAPYSDQVREVIRMAAANIATAIIVDRKDKAEETTKKIHGCKHFPGRITVGVCPHCKAEKEASEAKSKRPEKWVFASTPGVFNDPMYNPADWMVKQVECEGKPANDTGDETNHPSHYNAGDMEVIDAIEGLKLGFREGNALKYLARWQHKDGVRDLKKAAWYVHRLIQQADASQIRPLIISMMVNECPGITAQQAGQSLQALGSTARETRSKS